MSLTYQEDYEGYSIRLMQSHTTADDKTLSFKHEAYTNISINSNPTSLYTCSSSIGDGNKQNWCKETKVVQYINSGTTTTNTANLILGSSYYPFVHTLRVSFNY
nr:hypothetical protein [Heyndrickxia oleronia]